MRTGQLKASVVINTYNRCDYIKNSMISILAQSYPEIELIVVNGPSTDQTERVLDDIEITGIRFKRARCANRNLSESRNLGIATAAGDIIFFMDDDAVAHKDWVARLVNCYRDENVGGAGGFTFDHTGVSFQCRYTICDKLGNAHFFDTLNPQTLLGGLTNFFFPSLLGTNCSFSYKALDKIGGFDEVFEYMLDETDVCARIIDKGLTIVTLPDAYVFHKYAPSDTRTNERIPRSLLAPARSKTYFCLKHSVPDQENVLNLSIMEELERFRKDIDFSNKWFLDHKKISPAHYTRLSKELSVGISEGLRHGVDRTNKIKESNPSVLRDLTKSPFRNYKNSKSDSTKSFEALRIYFVSQGYPPNDTAGIARWTHECALSLTSIGHEVHVVTRSQTKANHVDFDEGIWIHSIVDTFNDDLMYDSPVPVPESIARRAEAVLKEIQRSQTIWGVDIVSAPIWDVEGILCATHLDLPVVTSLHTTYKLAMPFKQEWQRDARYIATHVNKVIAAERWLLENSVAILANSSQIISEIDNEYERVLTRRATRVTTISHGVGTALPGYSRLNGGDVTDNRGKRLRVLFVGRVEERKGPDQILAALATMPNELDKIELILVGSPAKEGDPYKAKVRLMAESLKRKYPQTRLTFLGYVSEVELLRHYAEADIFIAPSRFESFGLVLIEAMRHGTPVIACDVGGMREIVSDGVDGYLVKVDDIEQLADRLQLLIDQQDIRLKIGHAGRATYESRFTAGKMADSIQNMFRTITAGFANE